jgi:serine protease AprX
VASDRSSANNGGRNNGAKHDLYARMSGTSVSSAMVAGVAALVLAAHPDYTPTKTKGAIVASGHGITGSVTRAVDAHKALSATTNGVNRGLVPSRLLMETLVKSGFTWSGTTWSGITWEGVTWEAITWEAVTWEAVTWEKAVTWEGVVWESVSWEAVSSGQLAEAGASR